MASNARRARPTRRHHVVTLLFDGLSALEPAVASEFFGIDRSDEVGVPWYRHTFCTEHPGRLRVRGAPDAFVDTGLGVLARADTIIVPGNDHTPGGPSPAVLDALRRAHRRGARLVSFCTGAHVLAAAGILDGRRATTHWASAPEFGSRFPEVDLDRDVLYVDDGDVLTSAGSAACIDLALHIVRLDHGAEVANAVARDLVVPPHRDGGQAQFIDAPVASCPNDDPLGATLDWAVEHLDEPLSVEVLARHATMSPRTFARRFTAATGTTPHRWLTHQRVTAAQRLLETTDLPVEVVAERCGFGSAASLRGHFQQTVRSSPLAYRRAFMTTSAARA